MEVLSMKKKIILFALVLALVGIFVTCELDTAQFATVTFEDSIGENKVEPVTVKRGESLGAKLPSGFTKEGFIFHGWFDEETQTRYTSSSPVGANITLSARWSPILEYATVKFEFTQVNNSGRPILPVTTISPITVEKNKPLGFVLFPVNPRSQGWEFDKWYMEDGVTEFTTGTPINENMSVFATWTSKTNSFTVEFDPGPGVASIPSISVLEGECIDEWKIQFPKAPTVNPVNAKAFFVAWLDEENREYTGRTPITRDVKITGRWGLPPKVVDFTTEIDGPIYSWSEGATGDVDYEPVVRDSVIDGRKVIVNNVTYDVPYNTGRWKILYRVKFKWPSGFDTGFYTSYTIRARFYANQQGTKSWSGGGFQPNNPADAAGYSKAGLLRGSSSPSDDGWGQISWVTATSGNGTQADAATLIQRYNLDRKGGTINDAYVPLRGTSAEKAQPPYLIVQTSDNYIGHIEITEIVFHNGEAKYTMYEDEEGYATAADGR
jgi:uncharacterized repeat protein (TIGR02543 family)